MNLILILSFLAYTGFVLIFTYLRLKKAKRATDENYFLGGRSLTGRYISGTLLLTNLSAISFVGMSAQAYSGNMSVMGWEVTSGIALVVVALLLLPRYLKQGITTIPDFLESRYSLGVKKLVTLFFLLQYVVNVLPTTLYAGARVLGEVFDVAGLFGVSEFASIAIISGAIALLGLLYTVFGGLKAIATANSINSIGLVVGGLLIPILGFIFLGEGDFMAGVQQIFTSAPEKLQAIGQSGDPLPFGTLFTGLLLVNLYYWGTDQSIIQGALGAKNLEEGQKGLLWTGFIKVLSPLFLIVPGIIAYHIFGADAGNPDTIYTRLVNVVLPKPLVGLFIAVMFGAVLGMFSGVLNSAATLFTLNVYQPYFAKHKKGEHLVKEGRIAVLVIALLSAIVAPFILYAPAGLFDFMQRVAGFFSVPIFTIVVVGYVSKKVPSIAAFIALLVFLLSYAAMQLVFHTPLHFLHQLAILFVVCTLLMFVIGYFSPRKTPYEMPVMNSVDVKPWLYRKEVSALLIYLVLGSFLLLSNLGLLSDDRLVLKIYGLVGIIIFTFLGWKNARVRQE